MTPFSSDSEINLLHAHIARAKWRIKDLQKRGIESLHEFDINRGITVEKALEIFKTELSLFEQEFKKREIELKNQTPDAQQGVTPPDRAKLATGVAM